VTQLVSAKMSVMTADQMSGSADRTYVVDTDIINRAEAKFACQAVILEPLQRALLVVGGWCRRKGAILLSSFSGQARSTAPAQTQTSYS
jgi:hypothetical protein